MREYFSKSILREISNIHRPSEKKNIFIFSLPRSGSTWLMEIIWSQPGFKYVNEPLNLKGDWLQKKSNINGFEELYSYVSRDKLVRYFTDFISGRSHFLDPNPFRSHYRPFTSRIVFKVIHGGELHINEIVEACNGKIIYLVRNPIDVALSRIQLPRIDQLTSETVMQIFSKSQRTLIMHVFKKGDVLEKQIVAWCIQNKLALSLYSEDWLLISYEELVLNSYETIQKVKDHCQLPDLKKMMKHVSQPSAVSVQSKNEDVQTMRSDDDEREKLVNKWIKLIPFDKATNYFKLCEDLSVPLYNIESKIPDFNLIKQKSNK